MMLKSHNLFLNVTYSDYFPECFSSNVPAFELTNFFGLEFFMVCSGTAAGVGSEFCITCSGADVGAASGVGVGSLFCMWCPSEGSALGSGEGLPFCIFISAVAIPDTEKANNVANIKFFIFRPYVVSLIEPDYQWILIKRNLPIYRVLSFLHL